MEVALQLQSWSVVFLVEFRACREALPAQCECESRSPQAPENLNVASMVAEFCVARPELHYTLTTSYIFIPCYFEYWNVAFDAVPDYAIPCHATLCYIILYHCHTIPVLPSLKP